MRGWWLTASEWSERNDVIDDSRAWVVQPRLAWLASRRLHADDAKSLTRDAAAIRAHLTAVSSPTMVAAYVRDGAGWREESRGFIVPDDWPERARAFAASPVMAE